MTKLFHPWISYLSELVALKNLVTSYSIRISKLEEAQAFVQAKIVNLESEIADLKKVNEKNLNETRKDLLSKELHSKRFNFLIHGKAESNNSVWEN